MNATYGTTQTSAEQQPPTTGAPQPGPGYPAQGGGPGAPPYGAGYAPPRVTAQDPRAKSPALACFLSMMPGLGQVYVGYYQRGFVHALVVSGLIALLASDVLGALTPLAALFMAFFWLYNIIDAGRRASLYNQLLAGTETIDLPKDFGKPSPGGMLFGGLALIAGGVLVLLHTQMGMSLDWVKDWWPVAPILFGVYLLVRGFQERGSKRAA